MKHDVILRIGVKLLLPFVMLFALYVQAHGEYGPGGGFQAGVIAAGMVILYALIFGLKAARRAVPQPLLEYMMPLGVMIYAGTGLVGLAMGDNYLNYAQIAHDSVHGHEWGILLVELGVLVTVSSTMLVIFYAFAGRGGET